MVKSKLNTFTYLETNNILPESQAGFRHGRSTQEQLFKLAQDASTSINTGGVTVASLFDVQKAYDKVWIQALALKMERHHIPEPMIALLLDFASERTIKVKVNHVVSTPIKMLCGLAQGSILSPLLHNVWVSDIPQPTTVQLSQKYTEIRISQFADDVGTRTNARHVKNARLVLQAYNEKIMNWCHQWKMATTFCSALYSS